MAVKKRLLTGIQSSGQLHIGNYFGALKPFVDSYEQFDSILMVADYHALTTLRDPDMLRKNIIDTVKDYIAAGVDPKKAVIFKQSDVLQHFELGWIFDCLVTVPFLMQSHAYKDKVAKGIEPNAGLFTYPMLMAADILMYDTDVVPVGEDQRQHIEYAREAASKFNTAFGKTFIEPEGKIIGHVGTIPGTDGKKMSKSYGNTIPLFGTKDEMAKAVMGIVTDSAGERPENVYAIHKLLVNLSIEKNDLEALYADSKGNYKKIKEKLIEDLDTVLKPMREVRETISDETVKAILFEGAAKARKMAEAKMKDVRKKVGVSL